LRDEAFDKIAIGQTRTQTVAAFGVQPSFVEDAGIGFPKYAAAPCHDRCKERIWYENPLSMGTEAWSFDIDENGYVIKKTRWDSP
jgi:hypothetical protein